MQSFRSFCAIFLHIDLPRDKRLICNKRHEQQEACGHKGQHGGGRRQLHICNLYVVYRAIKINYTKLKTYVQQEEKWLMDAQRNRRIEASERVRQAKPARRIGEATRTEMTNRPDPQWAALMNVYCPSYRCCLVFNWSDPKRCRLTGNSQQPTANGKGKALSRQ